MFRLIKWIFFLAIVGSLVMYFTGWKLGGKTIQEHLKPVLEKKVVKEGIKDVRSLLGEGLKAAGEAISEDVTDDEKQQLDNMVKEELKKGKPVTMPPGQMPLAPSANSAATYVEEQTGRPSVKSMEAMPQTENQDAGASGIQEKGVGR
jgi:hypothetical protein